MQIVVEKDGKALGYIPEKLRTLELCKFVVEKDGKALGYVPEKFRSLELCKIAVWNNEEAFQLVSLNLKLVMLNFGETAAAA